MKNLSHFLIFAFTLTFSACQPAADKGFAIYLLGEDIPAAELAQFNIDRLVLASEPLISNEDVITYDRASHTIKLTEAGYGRVQEIFPVPVRGIPFVVCTGGERIYLGAFWTPLSSLSYDGVVILEPLGRNDPNLQISLGYPGEDFFAGVDPRSDPRILKALQRDGKLESPED